MRFLYTLFLHLYYGCVFTLSIWNKKAKLWIEGRKQSLNAVTKTNSKNYIWFHASSLGEFEQVSYLIQRIKEQYPQEKILVSFFSPSGYEIKKNFAYADTIVYLPFDFTSDIQPFIDTVQPKLVFWVRYEFWLNTLDYIQKKNIPLILLNGVFRSQISPFYKPLFKKCLSKFSQRYVISSDSKDVLNKLGFDAHILADTRYDRMEQVMQQPFEDDIIQDFAKAEKLVVCGSIWHSDDSIIAEAIKQQKDIRWILVPHEVHRARIDELKNVFPQAITYSDYTKNTSSSILIIDKIGLLSRLYRFADMAYVGGGFEKVVHSLIEPMAYSLPILIGKNIEKSEEAKNFVKEKLVEQVLSATAFNDAVQRIFSQDNHLLKQRLKLYFDTQRGSVNKILSLVEENK